MDSPGHSHTHLQSRAPTAILPSIQSQIAFDTHAYVKRLTRAGMSENQAEVLARGQSDLFTLKPEFEKLRTELKHEIETVRAELEAAKIELKRDIHEMEHKLTIKLGAIVVIGITVLSVLYKLL